MPSDLDLLLLPPIAKDLLTMSMGVAWVGISAATKPMETVPSLVTTAKQMVTIPEGTDPGLSNQAGALAGVWMEKGMNLLSECKTAGEKFTDPK